MLLLKKGYYYLLMHLLHLGMLYYYYQIDKAILHSYQMFLMNLNYLKILKNH